MLDIADKLFPNLLTLLTQLAATGVLYLVYRKYLHQPVMNYLDRQAEELNEAQNYAKSVEEEAQVKTQALEKEHEEKVEQLRRAQQAMEAEAERERDKILEQAAYEKELMLEQAQNEIEIQRAELIAEVEDYLLDVALNLTERTLENYEYDEAEVYQSLEVELEQMNNETH
jgi:F-type H+-transporting ATPase subunit b